MDGAVQREAPGGWAAVMLTMKEPDMKDEVHEGFMFEDAEQGLRWAAEVLRRRRCPRVSPVWREISPEAGAEVEAEAGRVAAAWGKGWAGLPKDADDRLGLALKMEDALGELAKMDGRAAEALRLWAWGDWADGRRLAVALAVQEKARREGIRVRIAYRYSYAQLGAVLGCDKKTAWRRVREALDTLGMILQARGLLAVVVAPVEFKHNFNNIIDIHDFK